MTGFTMRNTGIGSPPVFARRSVTSFEKMPSNWSRPRDTQAARALRMRHLHSLRDRAFLYAPIALMGMLALATYWLNSGAPVLPSTVTASAPTHEPDYFMRQFTVKNFDEHGLLKSEIAGREARHFVDTDTLEIDEGKMRSLDLNGRTTAASANRVVSNGDGSEVQLRGNALVVREPRSGVGSEQDPRLEFRSEFLQVLADEERVFSNQPVVLKRGADHFSGDSFSYDSLSGVAELKGRVRGQLAPRKRVPPPVYAPPDSQAPR